MVPSLVRAYFEAVDSMNPDAVAPLLSTDCKFRAGNEPEISGAAEIVDMIRQMLQLMSSVKHDYVDVVSSGNRVYAETSVEYLLAANKLYVLPFITVFEHRDNLLSSVRIYGDMSPLKLGWE
jgi:limonene-1,2-epoxide hydrolase